ncbi:cobalamin-binding protein [Streptomyces pharetrae]|uniref:cobalamin-binding protein n=1 Tax=Streptomyces pharetrae TaxID=291370 RepID=UPI00335E4B5A
MVSPRGSSLDPRDADVSVGTAWVDAPCPVLVVDRDGTVLDTNRAARALLAHPPGPRPAQQGFRTVPAPQGNGSNPASPGGASPSDTAPDRLPRWLADAHVRVVRDLHDPAGDPPTGPIGDRFYEAIPTHLPAAHAAITACQAVGVPVLAGGRAFGPDGRFAHALGADRWAADARGAAAVLEGGLPRPLPTAVRQTVDDLPHLADQEYTMAVRSRGSLVRRTLADLEHRFPAMRGYSDEQRERTAEDVAHIVDFLATALYVNDSEVFTSFLAWTADILTARRVPADSLVTALDILAGQSRETPRTLAMLRSGAAVLRDRPAGPPASALAAHA